MLNHVAQRLALSVPVLFGVLLFGFLLLQLVPADPAAIIAGPTASPELVTQIRQDMGLDRPVFVQFGIYMARVLQGDLGVSLISNTSVVAELVEAVGPTAELMFACLVWAVPLGIALGTIAAVNRGRLLDRLVIAISVVGVSTPVFFIAETETTHWYFWGMARLFATEDSALTETIRRGQQEIFSEDLEMLERQQANLSLYPERRLLKLNIDAGGMRSRMMIDRAIAQEIASEHEGVDASEVIRDRPRAPVAD